MVTSPGEVARAEIAAMQGTAATTVAWRSGGKLHLTVIIKTTFAFVADGPMQPVAPQEILRAEVHHGNSPTRSVRFTTDLAPHLGRADVLFTGFGYAPSGAVVQSMPVRLAVYEGERTLLDKMLLLKEKGVFQRVPIVYERAFGGIAWQDNPLGVGAIAGSGEPSLLDPRDATRPAGFGPIARAWPARKRLLGSTPRKALDADIAEIPDGFDWSYFQSAPSDQRIDFLRGDEWIVLEGLHPTQPRLRMRLPWVRGRARIYGLSAFGVTEGALLELYADTLRIDGDEQRCTVVWRRSFPVPSEEAIAATRILAGIEIAGTPIPWPEKPVWSRAPGADAASARDGSPDGEPNESLASTLAVETEKYVAPGDKPVLPFTAAPAGSFSLADTGRRSLPDWDPQEFTGTLMLVPDDEPAAAEKAALPFFGKADRKAPEPARSSPPGIAEPPPQARPAPPPLPAANVSAQAPPAASPKPASSSASPWAPSASPDPAPPASKPPARPSVPPAPPAPSPELKKGLYGKFGGKK